MTFETTGKNCIFGSPKKLVLAACLSVRGVVARLALASGLAYATTALHGGSLPKKNSLFPASRKNS